MKLNEINIRDPFILCEDGKYYMFGTRAADFGIKTGGFDVYVSVDLEDWSEPIPCCDTATQGLNEGANWAPEVWKYNDKFYMLATFVQKDGLRGTFALCSDKITGPYIKCGDEALTPKGWECLDGTVYIDKNEVPYLVFCHEHTQIIDGTICYVKLKSDFSGTEGDVVTMFSGSEPYYADEPEEDLHYITDGPFLKRTKNEELVLLWSTFVKEEYAQCMAYSDNGEIDGNFVHIDPLFDKNGGHGMIFETEKGSYLTIHSPNQPTGAERPQIIKIKEKNDGKGYEIGGK